MPLFATNTFRSLLDSFFNFFHDPNVVPREIITISSHQQGPGPSQPRRTNPVTLLPYPAPPRYISGFIELDQDQATIHGGYNDVSKGHHRTYGAVALRCPRQAANYLISNQSSQVFALTAELWLSLQHPNILPLLGLYILNGHPHTVSPWAANGTLTRYIQENPNVCRRTLLLEVAEGILYLHSRGVIHGDIKPLNMLVTADGHVQLCDFDLSHPVNDFTNPLASGVSTLQYQSPEDMMDIDTPKTFKSDVYAFGMTIYEVLSGKRPFEGMRGAVAYNILIKKERPHPEPMASPSGKSYAALWGLARDCWHEDPGQRPTMEDVVRRLKEVPHS